MKQLYAICSTIVIMCWSSVLLAQAPANDNVCDAIQIPVDGMVYTYSNVNSTAEPGESAIAPPHQYLGQLSWNFDTLITSSIWFTFGAPPSGGVLVDLCNDSAGTTTFDTQLAIYEVDSCADFGTFVLRGCQ